MNTVNFGKLVTGKTHLKLSYEEQCLQLNYTRWNECRRLLQNKNILSVSCKRHTHTRARVANTISQNVGSKLVILKRVFITFSCTYSAQELFVKKQTEKTAFKLYSAAEWASERPSGWERERDPTTRCKVQWNHNLDLLRGMNWWLSCLFLTIQ